MNSRPLILAAVLSLAVSARAQTPPSTQPGPDSDTEWDVEKAVPGPVSTTTAEGSFSNPEGILLGERMRQHAFDQICKAANIPINQGKGFDGVGAVSGGITRSMRTIPNVPGNRLGLVDEARLSVALGHTFQVAQQGDVTFGISVNSSLEGDSLVMRPLPTNQACHELKALVNLTSFKTVLPITTGRLAKMEVGELWKLPMLLTIGHSEGAVAPVNPFAAATLSFGFGQTGSAIMSVYRLSPDAIRFRFRVEHVRVVNQATGISATYPAALVFSPQAPNILMKVLDDQISRQISHYLDASFGLFHTSADGQQVLMEFTVNPNNPAELGALAQALKGDIRGLVMLAGRMVALKGTEQKAQEDFSQLDRQNEAIFGKSGNPGLDVYHDHSSGFHLSLPFFFEHSSGKDSREDAMSRLTDEGGRFDIFKEDKTSGSGFIDVPLKGQLIKRNTLRSAQTFVYESKDGHVTAPQAVYIYQEGFLREGSDAVRDEVLEASRLTNLAGARGGSPDPRLAAPMIDKLLPPPPPHDPTLEDNQQPTAPSYHDGTITFTLVMTEKAVAQIMAATPELLARCYRNTLGYSDKALMDTALRTAKFAADGTMDYDRRDFQRAFNDDQSDDRGEMQTLADTVSAIVKDVAAVRHQPTPQDQAAALSRLLAGKGESGLQYADIIAVLIQTVDPADITADLAINVSKGIKGEKDAHAHMMLKKGRPDNPLLQQAAAVKQRFAKPSDLVD